MTQAELIWNDRELLIEVRNASLEQIDDLALEIIEVSDPPVDTGYLKGSAYVNSSSGLNTFDETWAAGEYTNRAGNLVTRDSIGAPEPAPRDGAVVGWAADYAIEVEERTSFIYQAVVRVAARDK